LNFKRLQEQIDKTLGKELPTAAKLRNCDSEMIAKKELKDGSRLQVYKNGFALYETDGGSTVFRVDHCGGYTYFSRTEELSVTEEYFNDVDWWVRLLLEAEDRLTHNRNARIENHEFSYDCEEQEMEWMLRKSNSLFDDYMQQETLNTAFDLMTQRQREVVQMYYIEGFGVREIAEIYGVTHQAISVTLSDIRKKFKKNKDKFE
jgi:RNA polymerase sigma factor (sigma-70 family)